MTEVTPIAAGRQRGKNNSRQHEMLGRRPCSPRPTLRASTWTSTGGASFASATDDARRTQNQKKRTGRFGIRTQVARMFREVRTESDNRYTNQPVDGGILLLIYLNSNYAFSGDKTPYKSSRPVRDMTHTFGLPGTVGEIQVIIRDQNTGRTLWAKDGSGGQRRCSTFKKEPVDGKKSVAAMEQGRKQTQENT
jgi:hypothetical protein